jgi:hypothetical protein
VVADNQCLVDGYRQSLCQACGYPIFIDGMIFIIAENEKAEERARDEGVNSPTAPVIADPEVLVAQAPVTDPEVLGAQAPVITDLEVLSAPASVITDPLALGPTLLGVMAQDVLGLPLPLDDDQIFHAEMERKFKYGKKGRKNAVLHEDANQPKKTMLCIFLYLWANTFAVSDSCPRLHHKLKS